MAYRFQNYKIFAIEQTSAGYEKIKDLQLNFPVINVARSKAKLAHETPIIVNQFMKNLKYELSVLGTSPKKVLIIGNGVIGREIYKRLKKEKEVNIYDYIQEKSHFNSNDNLISKISEFDLIIGCTGKQSFPLSEYNNLKKNVILASASSSDREFSAKNIRLLTKKYYDCHINIKVNEINLLNSGFPITFTKHSIGSDGKDIQITMSLIFSAILLGISKKYNSEIIEIDNKLQKLIIKEFQK